jgi:hypothetical protein
LITEMLMGLATWRVNVEDRQHTTFDRPAQRYICFPADPARVITV